MKHCLKCASMVIFTDVFKLDKAHANDSHVKRPVHSLWPIYRSDQSDKSPHLFHFISFSFFEEHVIKVWKQHTGVNHKVSHSLLLHPRHTGPFSIVRKKTSHWHDSWPILWVFISCASNQWFFFWQYVKCLSGLFRPRVVSNSSDFYAGQLHCIRLLNDRLIEMGQKTIFIIKWSLCVNVENVIQSILIADRKMRPRHGCGARRFAWLLQKCRDGTVRQTTLVSLTQPCLKAGHPDKIIMHFGSVNE